MGLGLLKNFQVSVEKFLQNFLPLISVCDNCTQTLLDTIDEMIFQFNTNLDGVDLHNLKAPWFKLNELTNVTNQYSNTFDDFFQAVDAVDNFNDIASDEVSFPLLHLHMRYVIYE